MSATAFRKERTTNHHAGRASLREDLTQEILFQMEQNIRDVITADTPEVGRQVLFDDFLSNSRHVLSSLSVKQLQRGSENDFALQRATGVVSDVGDNETMQCVPVSRDAAT
jgi:hypothetical protein